MTTSNIHRGNIILLFIVIYLHSTISFAQKSNTPIPVQKLHMAYPNSIIGYHDSFLILKNGVKVKYSTGGYKEHSELMNSSHIGDIFTYIYPKGKVDYIAKNNDPGRIRSEELLKGMYGATKNDVEKNLTTIIWCPKLIGQPLRVTTVNNVNEQLQKVSDELDILPQMKDYLKSAGTFNWRLIKGSNRLSTHSFGIAIDIAVKHSNYWQWDCRCISEETDLKYKNRIPQQIVEIFEKHGFIWGGKWYHYDTMHFEYRPELLINE